MSITEDRQQAQKPTPSSRRPRRSAQSSFLAAKRAVPCSTGGVELRLQPLSGPLDVMGGDRLVYAVCKAGGTEPAHVAQRASCNPAIVPGLVEEDVSDEMLLRNVADGDKAAMHIIFARHRERVFRFIQRLVRNPSIVDDVVNQVFLDVWRSANRFESRARVSTWLFSIARFQAINSRRERTHEDIDHDDALGIVDDGDTPDVALDRKETEGILRACIDKLSPAHREIIDLLYYRDHSVAEAAGIIGIPAATVKSRIFYARKQLARILVDAGFDAAAAPRSAGLSHATGAVP